MQNFDRAFSLDFCNNFCVFEVAMSSEDFYRVRGCLVNLRGQDNLKTQKFVQKMSKITTAIYLYKIHFKTLF
jgi:hypothetical protein